MSTLIEEITVTSYFPIYTVPKTMNKLVAYTSNYSVAQTFYC